MSQLFVSLDIAALKGCSLTIRRKKGSLFSYFIMTSCALATNIPPSELLFLPNIDHDDQRDSSTMPFMRVRSKANHKVNPIYSIVNTLSTWEPYGDYEIGLVLWLMLMTDANRLKKIHLNYPVFVPEIDQILPFPPLPTTPHSNQLVTTALSPHESPISDDRPTSPVVQNRPLTQTIAPPRSTNNYRVTPQPKTYTERLHNIRYNGRLEFLVGNMLNVQDAIYKETARILLGIPSSLVSPPPLKLPCCILFSDNWYEKTNYHWQRKRKEI